MVVQSRFVCRFVSDPLHFTGCFDSTKKDMSTEDIRSEEQGGEGGSTWLSSVKAAKAHQGDKTKIRRDDDSHHEDKMRKKLSDYCEAFLVGDRVVVQKAQYSGKKKTISFDSLKEFCLNSPKVERKISFLGLIKYKHEISCWSTKKAEKTCKVNRNIILLNKHFGALPALFFPRSEDSGEILCKMTILMKNVDSINGEFFFVGNDSVTLNSYEFKDLVIFVGEMVDKKEGSASWRNELDKGDNVDADADKMFQEMCASSQKVSPKKFIFPESSDEENNDESPFKKGGRASSKRFSGKKGGSSPSKRRQGPYLLHSDDSD